MVEKGNITAEDALRHAEALNSVRVRKKGDAQRILLMNMVKVSVMLSIFLVLNLKALYVSMLYFQSVISSFVLSYT